CASTATSNGTAAPGSPARFTETARNIVLLASTFALRRDCSLRRPAIQAQCRSCDRVEEPQYPGDLIDQRYGDESCLEPAVRRFGGGDAERDEDRRADQVF